jgi:hypothetical protein
VTFAQNLTIRLAAESRTQAAFASLDASLAGIRTAVIGAASAFVGGFALRDVLETTRTWGNEVDRLQDELGLTAPAAAQLNAIARSVGLSTDELSTTFGMLAKGIADSSTEIVAGTSKFDAWRVTLSDGAGGVVGLDEALVRIRARFHEVGQNAHGSAMLIEIFGRSGKQLSDLLAMTEAEMRDVIADAQSFGLILDNRAAQRLQQFNRDLLRLELQLTGLKLAIGQFLLPLLSALLEKIRKAAGFFKALGEAISRVVGPLKDLIEKLGGVQALANALLTVGLALAGLAVVGGLAAFVGFVTRLVAMVLPLAAVTGGLLLVAGGLLTIKNALDSIEDPAKKMQEIIGGLAVVFAGLALALLPFNAVAALVLAALSLVVMAAREVGETILLIKNNWEPFVHALNSGQLSDIPIFGFFFERIRGAAQALAGFGTGWSQFVAGLFGAFNDIPVLSRVISWLRAKWHWIQVLIALGRATAQVIMNGLREVFGGFIPFAQGVGEAEGEAVVPLSRDSTQVRGAAKTQIGRRVEVNVAGPVITEAELIKVLDNAMAMAA